MEPAYPDPANQRLANHLRHEQPFLFSFLYCPGLDATNHAAEQAIRGMVIARKVWGGNRTWEGARTQQILVSVLRTCWQQGKDAFARCVKLMRVHVRCPLRQAGVPERVQRERLHVVSVLARLGIVLRVAFAGP